MATVTEIADKIRAVGERITKQFTEFGWSASQPFSQTVGGANALPASPEAVAGYVEIVALRVERLTKAQLETDGFGVWLDNLYENLDQIQVNTMNQGHHLQLTNALAVIQMIDTAIPRIPPREPKVNWEDLKGQKSLLPRDLAARLRSVDARITELEPRSKEISQKITDIEDAHAAEDQLPTDLAELAEKRQELGDLIGEAQKLAEDISTSNEVVKAARLELDDNVKTAKEKLEKISASAESVLSKSEHALRGATAVGLSTAFEARRRALSKAGMWWVFGLAIALVIALAIGWERVTNLKEVLSGDKSSTIIVVNALLAILGIGAPVWFAWLSTKQIGTTFRLAEDYAFKASVAQAYEGYRTEAMEIDDNMRTRLFAAALDRFEEAPIRLIDPAYHSSPLQELLSNPSIRTALEKVPNIAEKIVGLLPNKPISIATASLPIASSAAAIGEDEDAKIGEGKG